jgi:hypothetical protein
MRIYLTCMKCFTEGGRPAPEIAALPLEDSGLYRMSCDRGHDTVTCLQQMRFEVLVDLAAYAIVDGYYREAVSSFASALERFHEFYIRLQCDRHGIDEVNLERAWKQVASQSERQLGAFTFLYLMEHKSPPPLLRPADVEFRNAVIHKGKIPGRERAIEFGEQVVRIIMEILTPLRAQADDDVQRAVSLHVRKLHDLARAENPNVAFMSAGTLVCLARAMSENQPTLREWITGLEQRRTVVAEQNRPGSRDHS